jgi:hypothetical protein
MRDRTNPDRVALAASPSSRVVTRGPMVKTAGRTKGSFSELYQYPRLLHQLQVLDAPAGDGQVLRRVRGDEARR